MNIWSGYIGLAIAFVILSTIILWLFINTRGRIFIKAMLIPATVWYGLVLFYSVPNLMGWPSSQSIPDNSQVLAIQIKEPNSKYHDSGAIYLWISTRPMPKSTAQTPTTWLNPKTIFTYDSTTDPRAYKLPYSRNTHKAIMQAQRQMDGIRGAQMRIKSRISKHGSLSNEESKSPLEFEIINPIKLLPK